VLLTVGRIDPQKNQQLAVELLEQLCARGRDVRLVLIGAITNDAYAAAGVKLDFGKSCLRFKSLDRLVPEAVTAILERSSVDALIGAYEAARGEAR